MDDWISLTSALVITVGFASGVLSGMFGVGGAVLTTPGIRILGASPLLAVGSTVPAILPGAVSGSWRYHKMGLIDWRIALTCGASGSAFAVLGARVADGVNGHYLMLTTAALGAWSGWSVYRSGRAAAAEVAAAPVETESVEAAVEMVDGGVDAGIDGGIAVVAEVGEDAGSLARGADGRAGRTLATEAPEVAVAGPAPFAASAPSLALIGAGSGFVAGLLGVGGGVVMMPVFTGLLKLPVKKAVASSLVAVAIFSVPALITHAYYGHIDWRFALLLMVGVVPGARVGAKVTIGASDKVVRQSFGAFLVLLAIGYAIGEAWALLRS